MSYFNSITQKVQLAYDVSQGGLAVGNTYTGPSVNILGVSGIQFSVKSDVDLDVYIVKIVYLIIL